MEIRSYTNISNIFSPPFSFFFFFSSRGRIPANLLESFLRGIDKVPNLKDRKDKAALRYESSRSPFQRISPFPIESKNVKRYPSFLCL